MEITFREKLLLLDSMQERVLKIDKLLPIFGDDKWMEDQYQDERKCIVDLCTRLTGYNVDEFYKVN
tara:strand:- start:316 stop:513 length:198 start_codon:yes stop_codon:yes gene_type:complete